MNNIYPWIVKIKEIENPISSKQIIELVRRLPDVDKHIYFDDKWNITQEWLCGSFAGRSFDGDTLEEAAQEMIDYLYFHINHKSWVGDDVTLSRFPDLEKVEKYCLRLNKKESVE